MAHSHSIYVFDAEAPEENYWKPLIYEKISCRISEKYAVIYITEQNETTTVQRFSKIGLPVEDYIESGALTIIRRDTFYSPSETSNTLTEQWVKLFSTIEKKIGRENFKGFVAIGMPADSFFTSEMFQQRLVEYEFVVADNKFDRRIEAICCYTSKSIDKMPLKYIIMLLNSHQSTAHKDGRLKEWNNTRGVEIIKKALCEALGAQVSDMVFKILLRDFGEDTDAMILQPDKFEKKVRILFGISTGEIILNKIKAEFKKAILY